ncbi:MAG: HAMP domain-containing protein, partial [Candidatus Wallbacteria bacterium]|nr:HAMP domain-containing protein [Candidatus Wallbacteria bacterium]
MKIRHKLLIMALAVFLVVLLPSLFLSLYNSGTLMQSMTADELNRSASFTASLLEKSLKKSFAGDEFRTGSLALSELNTLIDELRQSTGNDFTIIAADGRCVTSTLPVEKLHEGTDLLALSGNSGLFEFLIQGTEYPHLGFNKKLNIGKGDFLLMISRTSQPLNKTLRNNKFFFFWLSLACLAVTTGVARITARRLSEPLEQLAEGVSKITRGDLEFRMKVDSGDELQFVADSINKMADSLKKQINALITSNHSLDHKNRSLDCLNQINQAIIVYPDLTELLQRILDIVCSAVNCEHGSMMTIVDGKLRVRVVYWVGKEIQAEERVSFAVGEGVAGKCLDMREG